MLVEDAETDAFVAQALAQLCGWTVIWKSSLFESWQWIVETLGIDQPVMQLCILIDMKMPDRYFLRLEGTVLSTWLSHEMDEGRLQSVPIVGYTTDPSEHRRWEAEIAGCTTLLTKPLTRSHFDMLQSLLGTTNVSPRDYGIDGIARDIIRQQHLDIMQTIIQLNQHDQQMSRWTVAEVKALVSQMTSAIYCPRELQDQKDAILNKVGGMVNARNKIRMCLSNPELTSLQVKILNRLINGVSQADISKNEPIGRRKLEAVIEEALAIVAHQLSDDGPL